MAAAPRYRTRLFVAVQDDGEVGYLLFKLNLKHLFSSQEKPLPQPGVRVDCPSSPPLLSLPDPVACFKQVNSYEIMVFSDSPCGNFIAGIGTNGRTLLYNGAVVSRGPVMPSVKQFVFLVPVSDRMFFVISPYPSYDVPPGPRFEVLQHHPCPDNGGRWAWSAVPEPPGFARCKRADVTAYFVSDVCVWISLQHQGTYSYDTVRRRWRVEGAWQLPIKRRGVLVSDFLGTGRRLLFGFHALEDFRGKPFCAVDMDIRPPAIVATWPEAFPAEPAWRAGYTICSHVPEVGYFGGGRFCLWVTNHNNDKTHRRSVVCFMAVELSPELRLLERKFTCYLLPLSSRPSPADVIM
ncbi:hypothetical protein VPH35_106496 [Triticum aestivum]